MIYNFVILKKTKHFCHFVFQISLVQFVIKNCLNIFGKDITSLLEESSMITTMSCDCSEKASGTVNNLMAFLRKSEPGRSRG